MEASRAYWAYNLIYSANLPIHPVISWSASLLKILRLLVVDKMGGILLERMRISW